MSSRILLVVVSLLTACTVAAQDISLKGPLSGLIYHASSRSIRPVVGFPGSSYLGKAVLEDVEVAAIAPDGDTALATQAQQSFLIRGLLGPNPETLPVPNLVAGADYVTWAANGSTAVVYSSTTRQLQRIDLLPADVIVEPATDLSALQGEVTCVVTNADATRTVIGLRHPTSGGLYAISKDVPALWLQALSNPGSAVFGRDSNTLFAVDRDTRRILRFEDIRSGGWEWLSFSGESQPLADPVGIALSPNGRTLYVAGGLDQAVREYDLGSRTLVSETVLEVVPQCLTPIASMNSVFILERRAKPGHPIWILSTRPAPFLFFVPADE